MVDNEFASRLLEDIGATVIPSDDAGSTRLCGKCESMNFRAPMFRIEETWSEFESNLGTCDFCKMRWDVSKHLNRRGYASVSFARVDSMSRMNDSYSPVLANPTKADGLKLFR